MVQKCVRLGSRVERLVSGVKRKRDGTIQFKMVRTKDTKEDKRLAKLVSQKIKVDQPLNGTIREYLYRQKASVGTIDNRTRLRVNELYIDRNKYKEVVPLLSKQQFIEAVKAEPTLSLSSSPPFENAVLLWNSVKHFGYTWSSVVSAVQRV